jgi:hypothetical protein
MGSGISMPPSLNLVHFVGAPVKKLIGVLQRAWAFAAILSFCTAQAWALPTITIQPSESRLTVGERLDVAIGIIGVEDWMGHLMLFSFDPQVLQATGVDTGTLFGPDSIGSSSVFIDNQAGTVSLVVANLTGSPFHLDGSGTLATFHLLASGAGTSSLSLDTVQLFDLNRNPILLNDVVPQTVTVSPVPEPAGAALLLTGCALLCAWRRKRPACAPIH